MKQTYTNFKSYALKILRDAYILIQIHTLCYHSFNLELLFKYNHYGGLVLLRRLSAIKNMLRLNPQIINNRDKPRKQQLFNGSNFLSIFIRIKSFRLVMFSNSYDRSIFVMLNLSLKICQIVIFNISYAEDMTIFPMLL